jgi:Sulfotransferase family
VSEGIGVPPETDCVFHLLMGLIGLGTEVTLSLEVTLDDGTSVPAGSISVRRKPLRPDYEPRLNPIVVSTLGRSGSTWLMQMLASHPEIVIFRRFPYESAPAKYWLHLLRVVSEPVNLTHSADPKTSHTNLWWIGNNPHHDDRVYEQQVLEQWFGRDHVEHLAAFCQRTIDDWYMSLARTQVQPQGVYFAEKHVSPNYLPVLTRELYPRAKEIFLVRDFRDMALSILAFDRKRGFPGFGRPEGASDADYMRGGLRAMVADLLRGWRMRKDRAHLVRYEDLVQRPRETIKAMLDYLGVEASPARVDEVFDHGQEQILSLPGFSYEPSEIAAHRTLADLQATIGRWRSEADREFIALSDEVFGEALREFGYDLR